MRICRWMIMKQLLISSQNWWFLPIKWSLVEKRFLNYKKMKKVLRDILAKFDHVVVAIKDSKEAWRIARISWSSWVKAETDKFIKGVWTSLASQILQETERRILKNNKGKEKWKKKWNESDGAGKNSRSQGDKQ